MSRTKSSARWMQEHFDDEYVKLAQAQGYRSRAVFKLKEIQEKDKFIKPGMNVVDLGAAPGGWSQFVRPILGKKSKLIALDILPMEPIEGVTFIQGDFREAAVLDTLTVALDAAPVDIVLSDTAPNMSGSKGIDQPNAMYLAELALDTAKTVLVKGGAFLVKVFQGEGFEAFYRDVQDHFEKVVIRKPKASRPRSNEVYILARGFK
ncbi:23S rRNA (uridine(2552)-2'-O)-methyltransferase RlmE [Methyloglobulus sp.]|uniref:23S rRNA (uridine(2552)-2'-O)-methyltransferase RlmE n=1 Tax=Methyloglobulus sp. TaxID=2518622 RepID=UPI00398989A2